MSSPQTRFLDALFFLISLATVVASFAYLRFASIPKPKKQAAGAFRFSVRTQVVKRGDILETIPLSGDILAQRTATLASETTGTVTKVLAREGTAIGKGKPLLLLDRVDQEIAVRKQEALLKQAEAALLRAKAILERDTDQYKRTLQLRRTQTVAEQDQIQTKFQREASEAGVVESQAQVSLRKAELEAARLELARTTLRAPFSGRVSKLHVEVGKLVGRGVAIVDLVDEKGVEIRLYIPPRYIARITDGMPVSLSVRGDQGKATVARIDRMMPLADGSSRNREVIALVNEPPSSFLPGLPVRARLQLSERKGVLLVRRDGLIRSGQGWLLYKIENEKAVQVPVTLVTESQDIVEVQGALKEGDRVVITGNEALFSGAPVFDTDPSARTPKTASAAR